ncbi:MAG TPA: energy transducer TonB [Pyrinomonadaceae bacterium]|nr:energy transducer TonB [Pyrinomonadaceae bacterium]
MKSPRPLTLIKLAALTTLSLFTLALTASAQDPKPSQTPPAVGESGGGPGHVSKEDEESDGPFRANQVMSRAVITYKPEPGFTKEARENDVYGVVRLRAVLSSKGEVTKLSVVKGLPDGLTRKAIEAATQIRFKPARRYGHAVSQYVTFEYNFSPYDDADADKKVEILEQPQPGYTEEALKNRIAGKVVIDALFRKDGTVDSERVVEGLPDGLSGKAIEAARLIKFRPAEIKGRKVTVLRRVEYVFSPDSPAKQ